MICPRCRGDSVGAIGSFFNTESICWSCRALEETHPDFDAARAAENRAVEGGDYNFVGVGLPRNYAEWAKTAPTTDVERDAAARSLAPYLRGHPSPMIDARRLRISNGTASLRDLRDVKAEDAVIAGWRESGMIPR